MRTVNGAQLAALQRQPEAIRNICILAHVDHGKTTLADSLLAANGIISSRLAGKLRYLDSRADEQERGITMKASSIALAHNPTNRPKDEESQGLPETYLINVIDSPGHVDFSSEVTSAVRLCDGAIVVVDVVEGVCAQTLVALKQAWSEDIKPILVLNKIDRLIIEWKLTPLDAYVHLGQLLEKVNAVMGELLASDVIGAATTAAAARRTRTTSASAGRTEVDIEEWASGLEDFDDSSLYFSPAQGNVVFASAIDGWAFRVSDFAGIYSRKMGMREATLNLTLWGDFYLAPKQRRILKGASEKAKKPLFVNLVLESLWAMYETVVVRKDKEQLLKMIEKLEITVHPRDLRSTDRTLLHAVMSAWLPLSKAVLDTVVDQLPSPLQLTQTKVQRLLSSPLRPFSSLPDDSRQALEAALSSCSSSDEAPTIVFISKMFAVERKSLPELRPRILSPEEMKVRREETLARLALKQQQEQETIGNEFEEQTMNKDDNDNNLKQDEHAFVAFARVYSGKLRKGQKLFVLGPKYDPVTGIDKYGSNGELLDDGRTLKDLKSGDHVTCFSVSGGLYQLMGRELEVLEEVGAGNILGVGGLESHVLRTATLSSTLTCPPFTEGSGSGTNAAVVRVAVEAARTCDMDKLEEGLKLLNQADPCVQVVLEESGERVLVTAGEVHLQRCIDDLTQRFANVPVSVGKPMVPFRETIITPPTVDMVNEAVIEARKTKKNDTDLPGGVVEMTALNKRMTLRVRAAPLPSEVVNILDESIEVLKCLKKSSNVYSLISAENNTRIEKLRNDLRVAFGQDWEGIEGVVDSLWAFGPKEVGPNVLVNGINLFKAKKMPWKGLSADIIDDEASSDQRHLFESAILGGFQLAVKAGPLCEEPMRGVAFIVEDWKISNEDGESEETSSGGGGGQLMSAFKEACRKAFSTQPQRLMVAMYSTSIQVNAEVLGKLYAVLGKRGGRVLHGDLACEGSTSFEVTATLPVVDSFDFANEVRRQTSGLALPQLVFSGWEVVEVDPFWEPTTEEELAHYGEKADTDNRAKTYMNAVRRRKGLATYGEKTVANAEKQRTLTRNK